MHCEEMAVDRYADNLDVALLEFFYAMIECNQFRRANESEIQRVEKTLQHIYPW